MAYEPKHTTKRQYMNLHFHKIVIPGLAVFALSAFTSWGLFGAMTSDDAQHVVTITSQSTADDIKAQLDAQARFPQRLCFKALATLTGYYRHLRPGQYSISSDVSTLTAFRHMRNGVETPVRLVIPSTLRTAEDLANFLAEHTAPSASDYLVALNDSAFLAAYGLRPETSVCLFLPNTYEIYWATSVEHLFDRMKRESDAFWTSERLAKLPAIAPGFTPQEAITLASIVEQETQTTAERPAIAGLYINRLHAGMPLQADPTVKFALHDFALRRILHEHLTIDSPYNTYRVTGLPPGPICLPSLSSIDAVLNYDHHNYLYMCAKEDLSGSHNFAASYAEHLANARKYADALDRRGIK